jgi:hypothetical protein
MIVQLGNREQLHATAVELQTMADLIQKYPAEAQLIMAALEEGLQLGPMQVAETVWGIKSPQVIMLWIIEESEDCGVHWRRAKLTYCYPHPRIAMCDAVEIIMDEWLPPARSLRQLCHALQGESVAYYWQNGIRIVRIDHAVSTRW